MSKAPAFPVYTKDFDTDEKVVLMDLAEEGAFGRLLRHQWREGSIPSDGESIARILRVSEVAAKKIWVRVSQCFQPHPEQEGRLVNAKTERVREAQAAFLRKKSEAGKHGAHVKQQAKQTSSKPPANGQPSVAVAVPVAVPVAKQSALLRDDERQEYAHEVWMAFCKKAGHPETRATSSNDNYVLKGWLDEEIPLSVVLRAIEETKGSGYTLAYYKGPVSEAYARWRKALQVTT